MDNRTIFEYDDGFFFIEDIRQVNVVKMNFDGSYVVQIRLGLGTKETNTRYASISTDTKEAADDIMKTLKASVKAIIS